MTVMLSAQRSTVPSSISSTVVGRRIRLTLLVRLPADMAEPTFDDIDALIGPATPHFAYQLRARVREVVSSLPDDHPVRRYGEEKMQVLERLGHASSKAEDSPREPRTRIGWDRIPSAAPAYDPLTPQS